MNDERIVINTHSGGNLYRCPMWWQKFIIEYNKSNNQHSTIEAMLNERWGITSNAYKRLGFTDLIITFPSEDVYTQFVLTYS